MTIAGGWLGTYYYDTVAERERFEASFITVGSQGDFRGQILDDGPLGEANVEGVQVGVFVTFTKVYVKPPADHATAPVYYEGEMSEDGKRIVGTWRIVEGHSTGTWEARRLWFEEVEEESRIESGGILVGAR
jgi:hypothetical protein